MLPVVERCELRRDLFASEMVIRAFHMDWAGSSSTRSSLARSDRPASG